MGLKQACKILRKIRGKSLFLLKRFPTVYEPIASQHPPIADSEEYRVAPELVTL